jgi:GNAT acetyltransferase Mec-17-like protein
MNNSCVYSTQTVILLSLQAQQLPVPITTSSKFAKTDDVLYVVASEGKVLGILRNGVKKLFLVVCITHRL